MISSIKDYISQLRKYATRITNEAEVVIEYRECQSSDPQKSIDHIILDFFGPQILESIKWECPSAYPSARWPIPFGGLAYYLEHRWNECPADLLFNRDANAIDDRNKFFAILQSLCESFERPILFESDYIGRGDNSQTYILFDRKNELLLNFSHNHYS